ncbi:unnamed protein product [Allacma fusca]|uniref:Suppressor of fused homolog n=1 Tax=Allacma fusca TaxID=39272 RepID=A0A8J2MDP1_9HEXA|nr:unnamed protein product [Allacma fusca]
MDTASKAFPGLKSVYDECHRLYPNQDDPLQASTVQKFWQGGRDPLDYISMYRNPGDSQLNVPPHWHYVSYGLSDLHGDNRVHSRNTHDKGKSGFGFELTFRLKREDEESQPPVWPAKLMQQLAKYVFASGNPLWPGDHVSWHNALDNAESRITHMLMCADPQLRSIQTPFGLVEFVQVVGITMEELEAVQQWNGPSFLSLMRRYPQCGGEFLVTDMRRGETIFEFDVGVRDEVTQGITTDGSNLSGVSAKCNWLDNAWQFYSEEDLHYLTPTQKENLYRAQDWDLNSKDPEHIGTPLAEHSGCNYDHEPSMHANSSLRKRQTASVRLSASDSVIEDIANQNSNDPRSSLNDELRMSYESTHSNHSQHVQPIFGEIEEPLSTYDNIHIYLNLEASLIIPLALRGRLRHGRHFTFKSSQANMAITLVTPEVRGSFASSEFPYRSRGFWLHVCMPDDLIEEILKDFESLMGTDAMTLPKTLVWPQWHFALTIGY